MNLLYRDACKTSNNDGTYLPSINASSSNFLTSSSPTSNSSIYSNMVASDGFKPSVASWNPSPYENLLISERIINDELTWTVVGANGHASFTAEKPKLLSKSPAPTVRPLKKLTKTKDGESKEEINILRESFNKYNKTFMKFNLKAKDNPNKIKSRTYWHKHYLEDNHDSNYTIKLKNYIDTEYKNTRSACRYTPVKKDSA